MQPTNRVNETEQRAQRKRLVAQTQAESFSSASGHVAPLSHSTVQRTAQDVRQLLPQEIMAWQRSVGNRAVAGLLARNAPAKPAPVQRNAKPAPSVGAEGGTLDDDMVGSLRHAQGGGSSMPDSVRSRIEPSLGADLSGVKVHTDNQAVQLTREMGAKAFTHKNHIFYGAGHSPSDLKLTTHEAVHTIQQGAVKQTAQRKPMEQRMGGAFAKVSKTRNEGGAIQRESWLKRRLRRNRKMRDQDLVSQEKGDGGSLNRVDKVRYNRGIGGTRAKKGYFKPDARQGMSDRSVMSSQLAKWLGMDVVSDEVFAQHGGEKGSVSADLREFMPNVLPLNEKMYDVLAQNQNPDFEDPDSAEYMDEENWRQDDQGTWYTYGGDRHFEHDLHNPETQKGLSDLQLFDAITGQSDRHGGNIYIDPVTGKVRGIDHDISFGVGQIGVDTTWGKYHGLPSQVDQKTAKRILKRKAKNLPKVLKGKDGGLSNKEIADTQARFREVKRYIRQQKKNKKLVKKWGSNTYQSALQEPNHTEGQKLERSYLKRTINLLSQAHERKKVNSQGMEWESSNLYDNAFDLDLQEGSEVEDEEI